MSVCFILQFNSNPCHALIVCTPLTRWLIETESPSGTGHVIRNEIALRKSTNELNIITGIEIEQLHGDCTKAQRYLDASGWWLHRSPFGVERLPVKLFALYCEGSLISVDGWQVTTLDLACPHGIYFTSWMIDDDPLAYRLFVPEYHPRAPITLESLGPLSVNLKELKLEGIHVSDFMPLRDVEILSVCNCETMRDISGLRGCQNLRRLNVSLTRVSDLSPLAGAWSLEEIQAETSGVTTIAVLKTCASLRRVDFSRCRRLRDLSPLAGAPFLEEIWASESAVTTITGLGTCANLKKVVFENCKDLRDLSPLAGAPSLEEIRASESAVTTITGLGTCTKLRKVFFNKCELLLDLSGLAGGAALEELWASESGVTTIAGLETHANLKELHLGRRTSCRDLSGLAGAPSLEELGARESGVTTTAGVKECPNFNTLPLRGTPATKTSRSCCVSF